MKIKEATETLQKIKEQTDLLYENKRAIEKQLSGMIGANVLHLYGNVFAVDKVLPDMAEYYFTDDEGIDHIQYSIMIDGVLFKHFKEVQQ